MGYYLLSSLISTFRVKNVEIFGVTQEERKIITSLFMGESSISLSQSTVTKKVQARFPTMILKERRVQFPNTLILVLEKDPTVAFLQTDYGYIALSRNGTVIMKERTGTMPSPLIIFYQTIHHLEYQAGSKVGFASIDRALIFIALLVDLGYQPETVAIDSVDMIACKTKGFDVIFSQTRPIDSQSHEVRQIIRQVKAGAFRIARLDLRFDKPVVQLPKK